MLDIELLFSLQFAFLLFLTFGFEVVCGMLSYIYFGQVEQDLAQSLPQVFKEKYFVDDMVTAAIDRIQQTVMKIINRRCSK